MASMNTRLNIKKLDENIVQKLRCSKQVGFKQLGSKQVGLKQLSYKQVGFKQLDPGVETGVHRVQDEKRVSNDDAAVAQRRLGDKQPEEKTNTNCLVKEREKVHLGIKVRANIMIIGVPGKEGVEGNVAKKKKVKESMKANLRKLQKYNAWSTRWSPIRGVMSSWNDSIHFCQWEGIACGSRLQRVTILDLSYRDLSGSLSPSIRFLSFLEVIQLQSNSLSGEIPAQVGLLYLGYNNLVGKIPDELGSFSMLNILIFLENKLEGGIPRFIGNLTFLDTLSLGNCGLGGRIPDVFHRLSNLIRIALVGNNLVGTVPRSFYNLSSLEQVFFDKNRLTGKLPIKFGLMQPRLVVVSLSDNLIEGPFPPSICNFKLLRYLDMSNNSFGGVIPQCFGNIMSSLEVIDLGNNFLCGTIPNVYKNCERLEGLILNGNQVEVEVPSSLSKCQSLKVLDLGNNNLNGTFPIWSRDLPKFSVLVLSSNNFHGPIGTSSTTQLPFPSLRVLDLSHNGFAGHLLVKYFQDFNSMKDAPKKGSKPEYLIIGGMTSFQVKMVVKDLELLFQKLLVDYTIVDLSQNSFEGEIPNVIGSLSSLKMPNLSHNNLNGRIPSALGNLSKIESLDLSSNQFTGEIPQRPADITGLEVLNLSHNHLVGRIPQGKQFNTFDVNAFGGNSGLCGFPLPKSARI
ncbi:leucine-rich repeat-containing protein [Tanacetum coccineum]